MHKQTCITMKILLLPIGSPKPPKIINHRTLTKRTLNRKNKKQKKLKEGPFRIASSSQPNPQT